MEKEVLTKRIQEINEKIKNECSEPENDRYPIYDGIVNVDEYLQTHPKILWILKEAHDSVDEDGAPFGGDWSLADEFLNKDDFVEKRGKASATYDPIIYASYGILYDKKLNEIPKIRENREIANVIKKIAIINVSKLPGLTSSKNDKIAEAYKNCKDILLEQIALFDPDVIIGGYTMSLFEKDLGIEQLRDGTYGIPYAVKNGKVYIYTYHPAQTQMSHDEYVNGIIHIVQNNLGK